MQAAFFIASMLIRCAGDGRGLDFSDRRVCERVGDPDLWRGDIGLAEDWFSQQQDSGEEKEEGDQAEGGAGCGHGYAP